MQHGMHNTIDLQHVEQELRNNGLKYHYLVVDARLRERRPTWLATLAASFRALFAPRSVLREERGV